MIEPAQANWMAKFFDFILHLDKYIHLLIQDFGVWSYFILFVIIFCETGLVVTPFLPGDSLLFACGAFAALGALKVGWLYLVLAAAAVLGDTANYWIGYFIGPKIFRREITSSTEQAPGTTGAASQGEKPGFLSKIARAVAKKEYLERTHRFYEKYGGETIIIARFVPIVRTFAPFVAGIGKMTYWRFISYNIIGGVGWVAIFVFGGYFFGNIPFVKKHFTLILAAIIIISLLPGVIEIIRHKRQIKKEAHQT
jgi:membrane-associated protein